MGFWIYMMVMNLSIPLIMIVLGMRFIKKPPRKINYIYGYRTSMSMKNQETWDFAHRYCGKLWLILGWFMIILSLIAMLFVLGKDKNVVGTFGLIICGIQLVFLFGSIFLTEIALRKNFDKHGNRKR